MIEYAILGIVQGLTEFLPVSSSGHLVIVQKALHIAGDGVVLQLVLHLGTLCAVAIFLRREILRIFSDRRQFILVAITTLITGAIGFAGLKFFTGLFSRADLIAPQLALTGIVVLATAFAGTGGRRAPGYGDAVIVGVVQALAIVPAISRSGMTIAALLFRKVDRETCFTFSFLVSIPAILGASLFELKEIDSAARTSLPGMTTGFLFSLVFGLAALWLLKKAVLNSKFHYFGYYCLAVAGLLFFFIK